MSKLSSCGASKINAVTPAVLLAGLLAANPCYADPFQTAGGGVFMGYGGGDFIWGFEGYATHTRDYSTCSSHLRWSLGPLARLTLHGAGRPSFTLAGYGARDLGRPLISASGEAGVTLAFRDGLDASPVVSPHTGVSLELLIFQVFSHHEWLLPEFPVGGGVRFFPTIGHLGVCVEGRPQRDTAGRRVEARWRTARAPQPGKLDAFRKAAAEEYASVPAFLQLARELQVNGAPASLVERALWAAADELRHTALCARAMEHLSGELSHLDVPVTETRAPWGGKAGIERLALESWLDGCLGEGLAAAKARENQRGERDPLLAEIYEHIARDEHRHAELGWDIVRFCLQRENSVRGLLRGAASEQLSTSRRRSTASGHYDRSQRRLRALCA